MRYLVLLALVLAGCQPKPTPAIYRLRIAAPGALGPVAPDSDNGYNALAADVVYETLLRFARDGSLVEGLAKRFRRLDNRRFEIELRGDASFSDGSSVLMQDVLESLKASGLDAAEDHGLVIVESRDDGVPIQLHLAEAPIFRKTRGVFLGSGPFVVLEQDAAHILARRRQPVQGRIGELLFTSYPTARDAFAHTLKGDADLLPVVDPRTVEFFARVPRLKLLRNPAIHTFVVGFNARRQDAATRRALVSVISPERVSSAAFGEGACVPVRNGLAQSARELPVGPPLSVLGPIGSERAALAVRRELGSRGGEIYHLDFASYVKRVLQGNFDLMLLDLLIPVPEMAIANWRRGSPRSFGYSNSIVDAALDKGDLPAAAKELEIDPPAAFICKKERIAVIDSRIKNAQLGPFGLLETLPEWEVSP